MKRLTAMLLSTLLLITNANAEDVAIVPVEKGGTAWVVIGDKVYLCRFYGDVQDRPHGSCVAVELY